MRIEHCPGKQHKAALANASTTSILMYFARMLLMLVASTKQQHGDSGSGN